MPKKTDSEEWRDLMTAEELAKYARDGESYKHDDSACISRGKKLVDYEPEYSQHQPGCQNSDGTFRSRANVDSDDDEPTLPETLRVPVNKMPSDPATVERAKFLVEAIPRFAEVQANCTICGDLLRDGKERFTLIHSTNEVSVYCVACFKEKNLPLRPPDGWRSKLSQQQAEIADRVWRGESHKEVAKALKIDPSTVSREMDRVREARKRHSF
jgi:helix-turn-helix protein